MKKLAIAATFSLLVKVALGTHDVGISAIVSPETVETAVYYLSPLVMIHNFGSDPESYIPARCWIDSAGVRVYDYQRVFAGSLPPGAESSHRFRSFDPGPVYFYYDLTVFTELASDEDRSNDTMRRRFYCSRAEIGDSMVLSEWVCAQVNGVIERLEYSRDQDISDFIGRTGTRRALGSCIAVGGFRFDTVFVGVNVLALPDRRDGDRMVLYVDDDGDGRWATDSSEGMFEIRVCGDADSIYWRPMPGGAARPAESCFAVSSTLGGNLQIEAALSNIGLVRWWRSFAAWSFWRGDSCWGWWPSSLPLARWEDPGQYGPIVWTSMAVQEPGQARAPQPTAASFVRGTLWLEPTTRAQEAASGWLLDLAGRRVMQLYGGWNDIGALAPGVYYIRLETSGVHISRKVILTGND